MKNGMIIHPGELSKKWIDRLADAGIDILGIHPEGGAGAPQSLEHCHSLSTSRSALSRVHWRT